jgi:hypothetical protein
MSDRALVVSAFIVGAAIIAASFQTRTRFTLSAADSNVAWRMDTWSGQIDICAAAYTPKGPVVRCGAYVVVPPSSSPNTGGADAPQSSPLPSPPAGSASPGGVNGGKQL